MPFTFERLKINDVILVKPKVFGDSRGFFIETYKQSEFIANGITDNFLQDNHSKSSKGVLRGLHYQKTPKAQAKLVRCAKGSIFDVAVDIRKGSPTFGQWVGEELTEENKFMLYVPAGFAHGFVTLEDNTEVLYKASDEYAPELDRGIIWNDASININWCLDNPLVSEKDGSLPDLKNADINFVFQQTSVIS